MAHDSGPASRDSLGVWEGLGVPVADSSQARPRYRLPPVTVLGARQRIPALLQPVIKEFAPWEQGEDVRRAIGRLPTAFLKNYGGPGGLTSLATGGGKASHTLVLLDGIPVNSPQFGSIDLAALPLGLIGRMEFLPHGGASLYGDDALAGTLNLDSRAGSDALGLAYGSYGWEHLQARKVWHPGRGHLALGRESYGGVYPYVRNGQTSRRRNNHYVKNYLHGHRGWGRAGSETAVNLWTTYMVRGIPGLSYAPTPAASLEDLWGLLALGGRWGPREGQYDWQVFQLSHASAYADPATAISSEHRVTTLASSYQYRVARSPTSHRLLRLEQRWDNLLSTETAERARGRVALVGQWQWRPRHSVTLLPSVRLTRNLAGNTWFTGALAATYAVDEPALLTSLTLIAGRNRHQPDLNDLYWVPGGNPALRPELSHSLAVKARGVLAHLAQLSLDGIYTRATDLIEWQPGAGGIWSPVNLRSAATLSWAAAATPYDPGAALALEFGLAGVLSANFTAGANHGKPLRYTSPLSGHFRISWQPVPAFSLDVRGSGRSPYITFYDVPVDIISPTQTSLDVILRLFWRRPISGGDSLPVGTLTLDVSNLRDQAHETVPGYPEPGRTITLSLHYQRPTP